MRLLRYLFLCCLSIAPLAKADSITLAGDQLQWLLPVGGLLMAYSDEDTQASTQAWKSYGATLVSVHSLKLLINKKRPDGSNDNSFPSGHTAGAFMGAAFLDRRYGHAIGVPAYALAAFTGFSRVHARKHDAIDVVAGAGIAIASSYYFVSETDNLMIIPIISQNSFSITGQLRF